MGRKLVIVIAALLFEGMKASAHHAFSAEYDEHKLVTVTGTVTGFEWTNPHAWLAVDGTDDSNSPHHWRFEMGSPGGMQRRGWKPRELKKGDRVTVDGYRAKNGTRVANARIVILPDGRKLFGGFQTTPGAPAQP